MCTFAFDKDKIGWTVKYLSYIGLVSLIAFGILCFIRWEVWFGNIPEHPYTISNAPQRILLTFGDIDGNNRNVSWSCGEELRPSFVELTEGTDTTKTEAYGEVFQSRGGKAAYYVARLRHLKVGTTYHYRVCTDGKASEWHSFEMPKADDDVSFLYVGDVQDTINDIANQLLKSAFRSHPDAQFLVCGGDLTERPTDRCWQSTFNGLDSIGQSFPILTVTGNHEYLKGVVCKLERRFSLIHSYFLDSMIGENQVFSIRQKNVQLFLLDSNREFFYLYTQRKWLEEQLKASDAKWKVVVLHHPLYSIKGSNNLIQRWMFDDLIQTYHVDVVLQGHEHAYARMTNHEEGISTTPIYTVSHISPKNYRIEFNERFDKFGSGSRYYQKIKVSGKRLTLTAYDAMDNTLYDSLIIAKPKALPKILDYGQDIPEVITFTPRAGSKKDAKFAQRIEAYKARRGIK